MQQMLWQQLINVYMKVKITWYKDKEYSKIVTGDTIREIINKAKIPKKVVYRYTELLER